MRLRAFATLTILIAALLPVSQAAQGPTPFERSNPERPARMDPCFQQFLGHLLACRDAFCVGVNCNEELLSACIRGARQVLDACLEDDR